ncbi:lipoprotein [Bordetella ansorpii]|uniref:Lipoprotein n=1 Tax=Bordetella ansorpii TaxID=288768 RepID=A0A157SPB3_9BORD|nr:lipoprotein [Bordetella ansorpii]
MISLPRILALACACGLLAACASGPSIRSDYDRNADFGRYRTFGFAAAADAGQPGHGTQLADRLKAAARGQMEMRGYTYTERDPDLLVNFSAKVEEKTVGAPGGGSAPLPVWGYRTGFYSGWPGHPFGGPDLRYSEGTLNIDVVDARRKQLVWEGVSVGLVGDTALVPSPEQVGQAVARLYARYPFRAGVSAPQLPVQ